MYQSGFDLKQFHRNDRPFPRPDGGQIFKVTGPSSSNSATRKSPSLKNRPGSANEEALSLIFEFLLRAEERLAKSEYPKVVLEFALVKAASVQPMLKVEELVLRLEELRKKIGSGRKIVPTAKTLNLKAGARAAAGQGGIPRHPSLPAGPPQAEAGLKLTHLRTSRKAGRDF